MEEIMVSRQCEYCRQPKEFPRILQARANKARGLKGRILCFVEADATICRKCCIPWKEEYRVDLDDAGRRMSASTPSEHARFVCLVCVQEKHMDSVFPLRT